MDIKSIFDDKITILNITYRPEYYSFDIECLMPNKIVPEIKRLNVRNFPQHKGFKIANGVFQIHQEVRVWLKNGIELKNEGWAKLNPKSQILSSDKSPFSIGRQKSKLLGSLGKKAFIGISEKMVPFIVIKDGDSFYRFSESEIRFILPVATSSSVGKSVVFKGNDGINWNYDHNSGAMTNSPLGYIDSRILFELITTLRKAEVI